jgi:hypothetical protein
MRSLAAAATLVLGCAFAGQPLASVSPSPDVPAQPTLTTDQPVATLPPAPPASGAPTADAPTQPPELIPSFDVTPPPDTTPTHRPATSPTPPLRHVDGLEASNLFWDNFYNTCFFGAFDIASSVKDITAHSDLVVRGTIVDLYGVEVGGSDPPFHETYAMVSIAETIKGTPVPRKPGDPNVIHVFIGFGYDMERLRQSLPAHEHLFFLSRDGDAATYFVNDYAQISVLRNINGRVRVIKPGWIKGAFDARQYPVPLEGTSFDELVERVREIVSTPQGASAGARLLAC